MNICVWNASSYSFMILRSQYLCIPIQGGHRMRRQGAQYDTRFSQYVWGWCADKQEVVRNRAHKLTELSSDRLQSAGKMGEAFQGSKNSWVSYSLDSAGLTKDVSPEFHKLQEKLSASLYWYIIHGIGGGISQGCCSCLPILWGQCIVAVAEARREVGGFYLGNKTKRG